MTRAEFLKECDRLIFAVHVAMNPGEHDAETVEITRKYARAHMAFVRWIVSLLPADYTPDATLGDLLDEVAIARLHREWRTLHEGA